MKKIVLIAIKLLLVVIFLQNIGFFSYVSNIEPKQQLLIKEDGGREDFKYLNEKIRRAEELGVKYDPESYFTDIFAIHAKERNHEFDYRANVNVNHTTNTLFGIFNSNVLNHRRNDSEIDYKKFMTELEFARNKCENIYDPDRAPRNAEFNAKISSSAFWHNLLISILTWLASFYLKNMPLALILLWIWWYQEKEKLSINNPLSFLICLLLYPIIIIRVWKKSIGYGARVFALSVEFKKRQTDIFSMISDNELADIKRFAKSDLKIKDYRKYLENRSLICHHALVPAIAVTLMFLFVPKSYGNEEVDAQFSNTVKYEMPIKAPPNITSENHNQVQTSISIGVIPESPKLFFIPLVWRFILPPTPNNRRGFKTNPDPVPVFC